MGLKRVIAQIEVVYPEHDVRSLDGIAADTERGIREGVSDRGGALAQVRVLSVAQDPDPEPVGDGGGVVVRPPGSGDEE